MKEVLLFQALSCSMAWGVFFLWPDSLREIAGGRLMWGVIMWAPAVAAAFSRRFSSESPLIPILGRRKAMNVSLYLVPFLILFAASKRLGDYEIIQALEQGLILSGFAMTLGEELGWRGFLTPHLLQYLSPPIAWGLTGCLWEIWHLPFRSLSDPLQVVTRAGSTVILACVLGYLLRRHNSLIICVAIHLWANLVVDFGTFSCYVALFFSVVFWLTVTVLQPTNS